MASYTSLSSSNSSYEDMSMHLSCLYISGNSTNIRTANSRRKNRKTEDFDFSQTWHSNLPVSLENSHYPSRSLLNSQRFSGSKVNHSQDKLQKRLLQRNHNLQQNGVGPNSFTQTSHPMLFQVIQTDLQTHQQREISLLSKPSGLVYTLVLQRIQCKTWQHYVSVQAVMKAWKTNHQVIMAIVCN